MKVAERQDRIDQAGGTAVFVAHDEPDRLRAAMLEGLEVPFPVLIDLERAAYRDWGLGRAGFWTIYLDPRVWAKYARMLAGGARLPPPGRDTLQLGGDFVVDWAGVIAYARPQRADDRPPVLELLEAMERGAEG